MNPIRELSKNLNLIELSGAIKSQTSSLFIRLKDSLLVLAANGTNKSKESFIGLVLIIVCGSQIYYWQKFRYWSKRGVKGPRAWPVFGNSLSLFFNSKCEQSLIWRNKYGRLFGYFVNTEPRLVCTDANVLKKICIKDFDKFPNRYFVGLPNKYQEHFLIVKKDDQWRGMRQIMTPTFTSGKMRLMFELMNTCANDLIETINDIIMLNGDLSMATIDVKELVTTFSMNSSLKSFYGINLESSRGNKNKLRGEKEADLRRENTRENYARMLRVAFSVQAYRFLISSILPAAIIKLINFPLFSTNRMSFFGNKAKKIVEHRLKTQKSVRYNDYLQLLIEAKAQDEKATMSAKDLHNDKLDEHHAIGSSSDHHDTNIIEVSTKKMKLTEEEVYCQTMMLMMVATDTTATLLANTIYLLAHHKNIQERLLAELFKMPKFVESSSKDKFDYDELIANNYLDCVVSESLRLMSPAVSLDRIASQDYYVEEYNFTIPRGTVVEIGFSTILRDPEYWPEPDRFIPDRFLPENKKNIVSGSYCPFGVGPRACIGYRFALLEVKLGLARLLAAFSFDVAPGTIYPPIPVSPQFIINEHKNLRVIVRRRDL